MEDIPPANDIEARYIEEGNDPANIEPDTHEPTNSELLRGRYRSTYQRVRRYGFIPTLDALDRAIRETWCSMQRQRQHGLSAEPDAYYARLVAWQEAGKLRTLLEIRRGARGGTA